MPRFLLFSIFCCAALRLDTPAQESYDLVIVAGQSNAVGFDAKPNELPESVTDKDVLFWWKTGDPPPDGHDSNSSNMWTTLKPQPLGNPAPKKSAPRQYGNFAQPDGGFGPEFGFARHLLKTDPDRKLAILKVAFSGTSIPQDWDPEKNNQPGSCYAAFLTELKNCRAAAAENDIQLNPIALIWVQGESDANKKNAPVYAEDLGKLIHSIRKACAAPDLTAMVAVNTRFSKGKNLYMPAIVEAQKKAAEDDPKTYYVDTSKAPIANAAHFDTKGTLQVGMWFAETFLKATSAKE
ncbi:MAG: hypothetical protein ACI8XO_002315 [Verrucomicrobiales bacterium]|jgi:hypothetical protein